MKYQIRASSWQQPGSPIYRNGTEPSVRLFLLKLTQYGTFFLLDVSNGGTAWQSNIELANVINNSKAETGWETLENIVPLLQAYAPSHRSLIQFLMQDI